MFAELGVATASGQRQQPIPIQFNLELSSLQNYTVQMTRFRLYSWVALQLLTKPALSSHYSSLLKLFKIMTPSEMQLMLAATRMIAPLFLSADK